MRYIVSRFDLKPGRRVLDVGCGPGLYTTRLAASGARVTGIDFSERSIACAREQSRIKGLTIDLEAAIYGRFALLLYTLHGHFLRHIV